MRSSAHLAITAIVTSLAVACGDDGGRDEGDTDSASASASASITATGSGSQGSQSDSDSGDAGSGSDSQGTTGDDSDPTIKFDLHPVPDAPEPEGCGGGDGMQDFEFSYIWIANTSQGTVSKIDTKTGVEEGRYWTDPTMGQGSPSRTSVNLLGDVAVSNRNQPSTTKIAARVDHCVDLNGNGVIDTSTGPNDVRAWGQDECVLWHTPFPESPGGSLGARPTQWSGEADANGCPIANPRLWVGYGETPQLAHFVRLDGATGQKLDDVPVPWNNQVSYGPYGGAVNADGDLWAIGLYIDAPLVHIDADTLQVTNHGNPGAGFYGIAIDADGNPWIGGHDGVVFFDAQTLQWTVLPTGGTTRGIAVDRDGRAWAAADSGCGLTEIDVATRTVTNALVPLPGCISPWGVAIDPDGYVWSPDMSASVAFKLDPDSHQVVLTVSGLIGPYTYSDMTGAGLGLVIDPPG